MKFEILKPNKIKIIIDSDDLIKWGISADALAKNAPETREMFMALLRKAEEETGFCCNNSQLVIEAAEHVKGDLTIFVTKVDSAEERALFEKISAVKKPETVFRQPIQKAPSYKAGKVIIEIENFEDVITFAYAFEDYYGGSLYLYDDLYYMIVDSSRIKNAAEFGIERSSKRRLLVEEHGSLIARDNAFLVVRSKFCQN